MPAARDSTPHLRSDARRNRRRLLEAAQQVMREHGLDASLGEIARRAGVGNATLYRHFPTREALFEAVFTAYGSELERIQERVLQIPDAWEALVAWAEETCAVSVADQAFADLVTHGMPHSPALNELCMQAIELARQLLDRAQRAGVVRADIGLTDLLFLGYSVQRLIPTAAAIAPDAWRRHLAIALDGLRPQPGSDAGSALPTTAMTLEQFVELGESVPATPRYHHATPADQCGPARPHAGTCLSNSGPGASPADTGVLSDELWELIEPELPSSAGHRGRPWRDHRQTLEAILWRYRTGCPWRELPPEFGPWQTLWKRHRRWSADGVYQRMLERVLRG